MFQQSQRIHVVAFLLAATAWLVAPAHAGQPAVKRVRPADRAMARMLDEGARRSSTFKQMVADLERSDVIVYVTTSRELPRTELGELRFVCARGGHRYLRATIRSRLGPRDFVSTIAHELQHALEVAAHAEVVDGASMAALYQRIGRASCSGYETAAAVRAGDVVGVELERGPATSSTRPR